MRWNRNDLLELPQDDRETLLMAANERWQLKHRAPAQFPERLEVWHAAFARDVMHGRTLGGMVACVLEDVVHSFSWAATGNPPDVRDSRMIAREFLDRVEQLVALPGGDDLEAVVARARDEVLDGIPKGYRRTVLDRVLDLEVERLRERGAEPDEVKALEDDRDNRRERGWSALTGKRNGWQR
jgi:hypothetical protein